MNAPPKISSMTSRQFNQDTARAKRAALSGPVYITSRGEPTHVLISKAEFDRLEAANERNKPKPKNLAEALAHPESAHFDFEPPKLSGFSLKVPDFK